MTFPRVRSSYSLIKAFTLIVSLPRTATLIVFGYQTRKGYSIDAPGKANMLVCSNALTERFNCPAMTLEMPFKDNTEMPNEEWGWSPDRCKILGAASLDAMLATFPLLREHPAPK